MAGNPKIVIIGAGPTGLGAAWRLNELGHQNWNLYEAADYAGGLATSVVDEQGFTWDIGGHVLFSHYKYFDELMTAALGSAWLEHEREAWVWMRDRWIPYPFQNNIWRLPEAELMACLEGLVELKGSAGAPPKTFREWLLASFGTGLCETFLFPYNRKVWAYDPARLDVGWMGERVARVNLSQILRNLVYRRDEVSWGPNATFRFPLTGGTGAIWKAVCDRLPWERVHFEHRVEHVDAARRVVVFSGGAEVPYDYLISTMPLERLLRGLGGAGTLGSAADCFVHSSSHIVGVGLSGQPPESLRTKCWMYFPEDKVPFYRVTVFSNYSPNNVPNPGREWSLMAEVSESPDKPVATGDMADQVIAGLESCGFLGDSRILSKWHRRLEYGYPTPWLGRDQVLEPVDERLRELGIFSRGRFGAWKYEVSNQDHSLMQGVEAVDHLIEGRQELTYYGDMSDKPR